MNKGFLTFSDDEPGLTMLKDEPEDLTHLAPVAGDECVPLETSFVDEFDLFLNASDSYPLLSEELCLSDSQSSSNSKSSTDPFFSYREDLGSAGSPSDVSRSHLGSPSHSKSPGDCSIPSLCSPGIPSDEDQMTQFMSLNMDASSPEGDDELSMRAPYIPMGDDLPLLISDDLMWGSSVTDKSLSDDGWSQVSGSNFVQLLNSDSGNSRSPLRTRSVIKCNDHGGGLVDPGSLLGEAYSRKNAMDWSESPRQTELQDSSSRAPSKEGLCMILKKNPPGVGPPDRCYKRAHEPGQNTEGTKRTKADSSMLENGLSRQLLQQLIKTQLPSASPQIHSASSGTITWGINKGKVQLRQQQRQQQHSPQHQQQQQQQQKQQQQQQKNKQQRQQQCVQQMQQQASPSPQYPHQPQPPQQQSPPQPPRPPQQPSDSVLMNLLVSGCDENLSKLPNNKKYITEDSPMIIEPTKDPDLGQRESIRKNSFSLLDPESTTIPSLADLSEQDYEVNAPVGSSQVLQGQDLLKALESSSAMME